MAMSVAMVCDGAAGLPHQMAAAAGIVMVPMHVALRGTPLAAATGPQELALLLRDPGAATTAAPSIADCAAALERAREAGATAAVAVTLSGRLSVTATHMRQAADQAGYPVTVVDSGTVAMAQGFAALAGAAAAAHGAGPDAVAQVVRNVAGPSFLAFAVDTLEHLVHGGRLTRAKGAWGTMLGLRPVLSVHAGELQARRAVPGIARAEDEVVALAAGAVRELGGPARTSAAVLHVADVGRADRLATRVAADTGLDLSQIVRAEVPAVLACHTGPGVVGIAVAPVSTAS